VSSFNLDGEINRRPPELTATTEQRTVGAVLKKPHRMTRATEEPPILQSSSTISTASMTTFATRPPLQQLDNPHIMSQRGNGRRMSARLAEKDNTPITDTYDIEPVKKHQVATGGNQSKSGSAGVGEKIGNKRKPGEYNGYSL
jgi:hypothetical protein